MAPATSFGGRLRQWAAGLKGSLLALWFCARDPRTPWTARAVAALVVGYAFSPIDLIPDFIPVLGYADDLVIVPLGIWLALRLVPPDVLADGRARAEAWRQERAGKPRNWIAAALIVLVWLGLAWLGWRWWSLRTGT